MLYRGACLSRLAVEDPLQFFGFVILFHANPTLRKPCDVDLQAGEGIVIVEGIHTVAGHGL